MSTELQPNENHQLLVELIIHSKKSVVAMGQLLYELHKNNTYKKAVGDGIETWRQYLAQPEISLSVGEASRLMQIYEEFVLRLGFDKDMVAEVPVKNLHYLLPIVKEETDKEKIEELLADATVLSQSDFRKQVGEFKQQHCTYEYMVMQKCKETNQMTKVQNITHEMILEAFNQQINEERDN